MRLPAPPVVNSSLRVDRNVRRNSWVVEVTTAGVMCRAGSSVEVRENWLAEGAWAGPFTKEGFLSSRFVCGSGAVIENDGVKLIAPSHSVEPIYCLVERGRVTASNSLHLIVALRPEVPPSLTELRERARTIGRGRAAYDRILYRRPHSQMMRFASGKVLVDRNDLSVHELVPMATATPAFDDYSGYRALLLTTLHDLLLNARDQSRGSPYTRFVTTVSSGYDSAACASLARELGCEEAVTIRTGRGGVTDSGKGVADALGLTCHEYDRFGCGLEVRADGQSNFTLDAKFLNDEHRDFLASVNSPEDLFFSPFEPHFGGAIVLTGFHGDKAWDIGCPSGPMVVRGDASGSGLDEFRKRVGFINVPVPFIGVQNSRQLARISGSAEMKPFRVKGVYDRPIPRRIAEEAGVPREAFGARKLAGSVLISNGKSLREEAFNALVDEYRRALAETAPRILAAWHQLVRAEQVAGI